MLVHLLGKTQFGEEELIRDGSLSTDNTACTDLVRTLVSFWPGLN